MMEKLLLSLCAAAGILVAGCSDPSDGESDIRIAPSITRVDGVNFTEGGPHRRDGLALFG